MRSGRFSTWLIPALVAAGWWRHFTNRIPLRYDATLWSIVFPLGMYSVAGIYLGRADRLPVVGAVGDVMLWFAFAAWALTMAAMIRNLIQTVALPGGQKSVSPPPDQDLGGHGQ